MRRRPRRSRYDRGGGGVSPSAAILSSLTVRDAHVVRNATATTVGDVRDIFGLHVFGSLGFLPYL